MAIPSIVSDLLTVSSALKIGAGALLHKLGQKIVAKFKAAEADPKKVVADVKKDL